jgi:hypothetical protein
MGSISFEQHWSIVAMKSSRWASELCECEVASCGQQLEPATRKGNVGTSGVQGVRPRRGYTVTWTQTGNATFF